MPAGAWMTGVLAGIEDATGFDLRRCEYFVGTSAGALLAARLAAGSSPERPADESARRKLKVAGDADAAAEPRQGSDDGATPAAALHLVRRAGEWALALGSPLAPVTLGLLAPGGAIARAVVLRSMREPTDTPVGVQQALAQVRASFDGRLRIVAVRRGNGRRTVFGQPGAPSATVEEAVEASCATPWLFATVSIQRRKYVDGAVWSPTNLDVAPAMRGTQVLCLNPTAGVSGAHPGFALARGTSRTLMLLEAQALRGRGASVRLVVPDVTSVQAIGRYTRARESHARVLAAGYDQGLALAR